MTMGYSSAGVVLGCGAGVQEFKPGDRVASNGPHAGVVSVSRHLCAHIPDNISFDHAAFTVLGAIALQGVRNAKVQVGETVLVVGLGLVGQLTVAILRSSGIRVLGTDPDESRCQLAVQMGAWMARPNMNATEVEGLTQGLGADAVVLTASTTLQGPIDLAANAVRKKGRVVLVGVVGLTLDRRPFYFKEAEFVVSCSYGPGRYDPSYEEKGMDYPAAYVRWTEQRNFQAVLNLMGNGQLDVTPLISHRFDIEKAVKAYDLIENHQPYLGILLQYPETIVPKKSIELKLTDKTTGKLGIGVLGVGNFAKMVLIPAIKEKSELRPHMICSAGGVSAVQIGEKVGFKIATTDEAEVFASPDVSAVFVLTRHNDHARQVVAALRAGKNVFVEKPLAMTLEELAEIESALVDHASSGAVLMVGFNRRFSPAAQKVKAFFSKVTGPKTVQVRFNAGAIPAEHWTQDETLGGGRIIGEACHAIDLAVYLTGSLPVRVYAESVGAGGTSPVTDDQCFITIRHVDGSITSVSYQSGGDKAFPKERVEMYAGGRVAVIDDFRKAEGWVNGKAHTLWSGSQNKGHKAEIASFTAALQGSELGMSWDEMKSVTAASILAVRSIREGMPFEL
jgi:predicted dehydrogenase/threonine dehydrogenase-like Zn-dependent dehydrogenase